MTIESPEDTRTPGSMLTAKLGKNLDCVKILVLINVLVFIGMVCTSKTGLRALIIPNPEALFYWGANLGAFTVNGQYWRLFTSMFVHASIIHLTLNMWALYMFGPDVKGIFGTPRFLAVYIFSGLGGALASIVWNPTQTSSGASGAIVGIAGAMLASLICGKKSEYSNIQPVIFLGVICASLLGGFFYPEIDNAAHVGGLFAGFISGLLLMPYSKENKIFMVSKMAALAVLTISASTASIQAAKADKRSDVYRIDANGMANLRNEKFEEAFYDYDKILKTEIDSKYFVGRAAALIGLKRYQQAMEDCNRAIAANPKDINAYLSRARVSHELGEFEKAVQDLSIVINREPKQGSAYNSRAWSEIALRQYDNALRDANTSLKLNPDTPETLDTRGLAFYCMHDYHKAMIDYERGIELKPNDGACHFHLAMLYEICGQFTNAEQELQLARSLKYVPATWELNLKAQAQIED